MGKSENIWILRAFWDFGGGEKEEAEKWECGITVRFFVACVKVVKTLEKQVEKKEEKNHLSALQLIF